MLGKKKTKSGLAIVAAGMQIDGNCIFEGHLHVDGRIIGAVVSNASKNLSELSVSQTGCIEGAVEADHLIIKGTVIGPVHARQSLRLESTARIEGDLTYKTLEMLPGAAVTGQLKPQMTPLPQPRQDDIEPHMQMQASQQDVRPKDDADASSEPSEPRLDF